MPTKREIDNVKAIRRAMWSTELKELLDSLDKKNKVHIINVLNNHRSLNG